MFRDDPNSLEKSWFTPHRACASWQSRIEKEESVIHVAAPVLIDPKSINSWLHDNATWLAGVIPALLALLGGLWLYSLKEGSRLAKRMQIFEAASKEVDLWIKVLTAEKEFIAFSWTKDGPFLKGQDGIPIAELARTEFEAIIRELNIALPKTDNRFTHSKFNGRISGGGWAKSFKLPEIVLATKFVRFTNNLWNESWKMVFGITLNILRVILVLGCVAELILSGLAIYGVNANNDFHINRFVVGAAGSAVGLFLLLIWLISKISEALDRLAQR
jgi:hypothetical protein